VKFAHQTTVGESLLTECIMSPTFYAWYVVVTLVLLVSACARQESGVDRNSSLHINLQEESVCDTTVATNPLMKRYFDGMKQIYSGSLGDSTCFPVHNRCGWPVVRTPQAKNLPLFVLSVGLEGAGHHLWTEIMEQPVFDCVWTNARHYFRDIADGVPRTTAAQLKSGLQEQFQMRKASGKPPCKTIYDSEDSFPTGAIRQNGRVFMRPDIVNLQQLDGVLFNVKYLLILRNTTVRIPCMMQHTPPTLQCTILYISHPFSFTLLSSGHCLVGSAAQFLQRGGSGAAHGGTHADLCRSRFAWVSNINT